MANQEKLFDTPTELVVVVQILLIALDSLEDSLGRLATW